MPAAVPHDARLWRGLFLVCLAGVVWGTIGPAVRLVHDRSGLSPLPIGAYRAIAAVAVLLATAAAMRRLRGCVAAGRRHWRRVTAVGLLTAAFQLLFFVAVLGAGVSVATVVCLGFAPLLLLVIGVTAAALVPGGLLAAWLSGERLVTADTGSWQLIVYLGVVTMAVAYALLFAGLRTTPSGSATVATLLEPVTAVVIAVAFLGERLAPGGIAGTLLIMAAIGSLGRGRHEAAPQ